MWERDSNLEPAAGPEHFDIAFLLHRLNCVCLLQEPGLIVWRDY